MKSKFALIFLLSFLLTNSANAQDVAQKPVALDALAQAKAAAANTILTASTATDSARASAVAKLCPNQKDSNLEKCEASLISPKHKGLVTDFTQSSAFKNIIGRYFIYKAHSCASQNPQLLDADSSRLLEIIEGSRNNKIPFIVNNIQSEEMFLNIEKTKFYSNYLSKLQILISNKIPYETIETAFKIIKLPNGQEILRRYIASNLNLDTINCYNLSNDEINIIKEAKLLVNK